MKTDGVAMFDFKHGPQAERSAHFDRIARETGDDRFLTRRELKALPDLLAAGEQVFAFSSGFMDGKSWLIVLTDKRILFLNKGFLYGLDQSSISLDKINSISGSTGILFGDIVVEDGANKHWIKRVWKGSVAKFIAKAREVMENRKQGVGVSDEYARYAAIEWLATLKERGSITQDEFDAQKRLLLARQQPTRGN